MTTKLQWRLSKLPTPSEITDLVHNKIITQEEAREMLVSTVEERDIDSLKEEIKFLRELVEKLSDGKMSKIVETIRIVEKPYTSHQWITPYTTWSTGNITSRSYSSDTIVGGGTVTVSGSAGASNTIAISSTKENSFSSINTF